MKLTIKILRVGQNFGWCAEVRRGRKIVGETMVRPTRDGALLDAEALVAKLGMAE